MSDLKLKVKKLHPDAILPTRGSEKAAGLDLFAWFPEPELPAMRRMPLSPGERHLFATRIAVEIPEGFEGQIRPRSGMAWRNGVTVLNAPGTIDSDFRGELGVLLINHGQLEVTITHGDRIAQLVIAPVTKAQVIEVDELSDTTRGDGGFGSTGR